MVGHIFFAGIQGPLELGLGLVFEPGRFLFEPAGEERVYIAVALVVEAVVGVFEDVHHRFRHHAANLVCARDQDGQIHGAKDGGDRDAGGNERGASVFAAAHREIPEGGHERTAIAALFHLFTDIALQPVPGRKAGLVVLRALRDRLHGQHAL